MEISDSKLIVKVRMGREKFMWEDALIDTGSAFTVIPPEIDDFLELKPHEEMQKVRLITASGLIEPEVKVLDQVEVAGMKIDNLPVVLHEIPDPAPIKVLLGMNFIERITLLIKGKERIFEIEN